MTVCLFRMNRDTFHPNRCGKPAVGEASDGQNLIPGCAFHLAMAKRVEKNRDKLRDAFQERERLNAASEDAEKQILRELGIRVKAVYVESRLSKIGISHYDPKTVMVRVEDLLSLKR